MSDIDWFSLTAEQIRAAIDARPETWKPVPRIGGCQFSVYQASDKGRARSLDRVSGGRKYPGTTFKATPSKDGYVRISLTCDDGHKHKVTMQKVILATFTGEPCPDGMESRHGPAGPSCNAWPENLTRGTGEENAADKPEPPAPPAAIHPCRNSASGCLNLVQNPGRRCLDCRAAMGRDTAARLRGGENLLDVAQSYGNSPGWAYKLAVQHGGYEGTEAEALALGRDAHRPCPCPDCAQPQAQPVTLRRWLRSVMPGGDRQAGR